MTCLRVYTQHMYPQQSNRFQDLLVRLPEVSLPNFSLRNISHKQKMFGLFLICFTTISTENKNFLPV